MKSGRAAARVTLPRLLLLTLLLRGSAWTSLAARLDLARGAGSAEASAISSRRLLRRFAGASSRLEFHTASARAGLRLASMKGFGEGPFPAAICSMLRPEATERSASSTPSPEPGRAASSLCLISSQLVRLPPTGRPSCGRAPSFPWSFSPSRRISARRPPVLPAANGLRAPSSRGPTASPCRRHIGPWEWCPRIAVFQRVILDLHRQPLVLGIQRGPRVTAQDLNTPSSSRRKS